MRKKIAHIEGRSLKTLLLYGFLVFIAITISLLVKIFFVIRASKFDQNHHFVVAIVESHRVGEVLVVNPDANSMVMFLTSGSKTTLDSLGRQLLILPDASIILPDSMPISQNASHMLSQTMLHFPTVKTNLSFYDLVRLYFFTKSVPSANSNTLNLQHHLDATSGSRLLLDSAISQENMTIQIINATDIPGLGTRLAAMLSLMGANIVDVSTALTTQPSSKIQYYGDKSYTLLKLSQLLAYPVSTLSSQTVANIVITLGENVKNNLRF